MSPLPQEVQALLSHLSRHASPDTHIGRIDLDAESGRGAFSLYTAINEYRISYRLPREGDGAGGYLGCVAVSRTPRAGEDWFRGNDLHDGEFSAETWQGILADVVSYEMVRVARRPSTSRVL